MSTFNSVMFNYGDDNNRATVSLKKNDSSHTINKVRGRFGLERYGHVCSRNVKT